MKKWRPEGWVNPYYSHFRGDSLMSMSEAMYQPAIHDGFEKGADAMLKALKNDGSHFEPGEWTDDATFQVEDAGGTVVFIPDDEE